MSLAAPARSDADHQLARFRAAARLGSRVSWFHADFDAEPTDGSVIGPDAALCPQDATERDVSLVTPETIDRYLLLEQAGDDHRTCIPFTYPTLAQVRTHIEVSAESAEALIAVFDLDLERQVPVDVEVVVTASFPAHREWVRYDAPPSAGPRVIAVLVFQAWVKGNAINVDGHMTWDATPQIERMGQDAALALEDNRAATEALVPPELLDGYRGPYRVEIADAIASYFAARDAA